MVMPSYLFVKQDKRTAGFVDDKRAKVPICVMGDDKQIDTF